MQKITFLLLVLIVLSGGCSVLKKSERGELSPREENAKSEFAGSIAENNLSRRNFFIRKAEITVTSSKSTDRFDANIRFKSDSLLISIRSRIGIEAARALLTHDTILINDKVNKKLLTGSTGKLEGKYGIDLSMIFALLGDFIIDKKDEQRMIKCQNGFYKDSFIVNERRVEYTVDCKRKKITSAYFEGTLTTGNINIVFGSFRNMGGLLLPGVIEMKDDLSELKINLEIDNAEIGWNGFIEFIPGNGYEVGYLK